MKTYKQIYAEWRKAYWANPNHYGRTGNVAHQLRNAKRIARVRAAWEKAEDAGLVRLRIAPDDHCDLEDLLGEGYDPKVNPDIRPEKLSQERQWEIDRIERDGVWGVIGEYKGDVCPTCGCGGEWMHGDSCWGFVGDDWKDDADVDIMEETLAAAGLDKEPETRFFGTFTAYGYTIWRTIDGRAEPCYRAGNCRYDSSQTFPRGTGGTMDLDAIQSFCESTGIKMAQENGAEWSGCKYDEVTERSEDECYNE